MRGKLWQENWQAMTPLEVDEKQWKAEVKALELTTPEGEPVHYQGKVLSALPDQLHAISFAFTSSALRPAELYIPLVVSMDAEVKLFIGNKEVGTIAVPKQDAAIQYLIQDVTEWSAAETATQLRLQIAHPLQAGVTTFFLEQTSPELHPRLRQPWSYSYAAQALLFFVLAWGSLLGLGVLLVAHLQFLGDTLRYYAALTLVGGWAASVLGLPDLAKIPVRAWLRRCYARTRKNRLSATSLLLVLFLLVVTGAGLVAYSLNVRHTYAKLIGEALDKKGVKEGQESLRHAFLLLPWRKEAQILFERSVWLKRVERQGFKLYVRAFTTNEEVRQAVEQALAGKRDKLTLKEETSEGFSDPVVWYASLLPEGELDGQTEQREAAIALLARKTGDPTADLQRLMLQLELYDERFSSHDKAWQEEHFEEYVIEVENYLGQLQDLFKQTPNPAAHFADQFSYQVACDLAASIYLKIGRPEDAMPLFEAIMKTRSYQQGVGHKYLWHRPPVKLNLYRMYVVKEKGAKSRDEMEERALALLKETGFAELFAEHIFTKYPKELWEVSNVISDGQEVEAYIKNNLLNRNWRY